MLFETAKAKFYDEYEKTLSETLDITTIDYIVVDEGIACYKDFVLHDISIHGIGPVQVRQHEEFQRFIANLNKSKNIKEVIS